MTPTTTALFAAAMLTLAGCSGFTSKSSLFGEDAPTAAPAMSASAGAPLFDDLGDHRHPITTSSELAQRYFDQGLVLAYGFNHAEAVRSFRAAQSLDPGCAMCAWGAAYALGPNINLPMSDEAVPQAWAELQKALRNAENASPRERAYINALAKRYVPEPVADRSSLDAAYAEAMGRVAADYPDDLDAATLYAEAVMTTMPWDYYRADGTEKPATTEIVEVLETVMAAKPDHPGAIHFYIHAVEPSSTPERAEAPADRLADLVPGAGHLVHMPSHIYFRVGRYHDASTANERAAEADESYIAQCRAQGFYPAAYYPHNIHFLWASATVEGRSEVAIDAARRLRAAVPDQIYAALPPLEEFRPVPMVTLVRFGRWDEVLDIDAPPSDLVYSTGMWHYARGMAYVGKGKLEAAKNEYTELVLLSQDEAVADLVLFSSSSATALLEIAGNVLSGAIASAEGDYEAAIASFEEGAKIQDGLPYTEPPPWHFPVRLALGDAYLDAGAPAEAERVFREALVKQRRDGWALFGLARSLRAQGKNTAANTVDARFADAWQLADIKLTASMM